MQKTDKINFLKFADFVYQIEQIVKAQFLKKKSNKSTLICSL